MRAGLLSKLGGVLFGTNRSTGRQVLSCCNNVASFSGKEGQRGRRGKGGGFRFYRGSLEEAPLIKSHADHS